MLIRLLRLGWPIYLLTSIGLGYLVFTHKQIKPIVVKEVQKKKQEIDPFIQETTQWINEERKRLLGECIEGLSEYKDKIEAISILCDDAIERCTYQLKKCKKLPTKKPSRYYE